MFGISPEQMAAYAADTQAQYAQDAKDKAAHAASEAKKSPEEKLADAFRSCREAGKKLPNRLLGIVDRETGKLTDQFTILEDHADEVAEIVMEEFLEHLDIALRERSLLNDEDE